jgi:HTH-type transcriptional regulator/antitoxin HipB
MLAHTLRNERKKRNQSQSKTADSIGLKQATVSAFENNPDGTGWRRCLNCLLRWTWSCRSPRVVSR